MEDVPCAEKKTFHKMSLRVVIVLHPLSVSRNSGILLAFGT
jgi:hypothetical protein